MDDNGGRYLREIEPFLPLDSRDVLELSEDQLDHAIYHWSSKIMASSDGDRITRLRKSRQPFIDEAARRAAAVMYGSSWSVSTTFHLDTISPEAFGLLTGQDTIVNTKCPTIVRWLSDRYTYQPGGASSVLLVADKHKTDLATLSKELRDLKRVHSVTVQPDNRRQLTVELSTSAFHLFLADVFKTQLPSENENIVAGNIQD